MLKGPEKTLLLFLFHVHIPQNVYKCELTTRFDIFHFYGSNRCICLRKKNAQTSRTLVSKYLRDSAAINLALPKHINF